MLCLKKFASCALILALPLLAVAAERTTGKTAGTSADWPQWRGPDRTGVSRETGLLKSWKTQQPELVWKTSGLGVGYSSVSIADGRIFTMGDRDDGQYVIALDRDGGKELWATKIGNTWQESSHPHAGPRCTPTVDGDRVYAIGPHGDLACLKADNGQSVWQLNLQKDFGGKMHSGWGYSVSPLVDGDRLVCTPGGQEAMIVALNKMTGQEIWRCPFPNLGDKGEDGAGYSSIVISEAAGERQYVQLVGRGLVGVSDDGKFLWGYNKIANGTANIPTPIVTGDFVFGSTGYGDGGSALLRIARQRNGLQANEVWYTDAKEFQVHHGGMILLGKYLYAGHGHNNGFPTCVDFKTGKIVWGKQRGPGSRSAAIAYADGNLYFRYENGVMALIKATPQGYQEMGTFQLPDSGKPSWPHPVIAGGKLYVREQDDLLVYNLKP